VADACRQFQKDVSAAAERITGTFTCSNNRHVAHGAKFIVNGRMLCQRCKELRDQHHAAAMKARKRLRA
jgi:hypothetical protein